MASRWSACSRPRWLLALLSWRDGPDPQPRPPAVLVSQREKSVERFQGVLVRRGRGTQNWIAPGQRQEGGQAGEQGGGGVSEGRRALGRKGTSAAAEPLAQPLCGGFSLLLKAERRLAPGSPLQRGACWHRV